MALALYRKYRPQTFAEVIGQEHVTEPLIAALTNGRLNHAYLFSGPRGCGKTSSARILARSLNCEKGPTPTPCGECASCVALAAGGPGSIDVIEIDAASHGGVDDARELRERAVFAPVSSRFKVYVIDEAHMVSSAGFNALLKLVEEPPDYVMFVFATTEPEKVLPTIRSRTHHYPFRLMPPTAMRGLCERLCEAENVRVDPQVYPLVVRAGGGSARDTLSVLDQLIAGAGEEGVTYERAVALLGVTDSGLIDQMCDALAALDGSAALACVEAVAAAGHDPRRFTADLLERLRDLIVLNQLPDAASQGLIDVPSDVLERMTGQALRMGTATLSRMAEIMHEALTAMRGTTAPRLLLELACAKAILPTVDDSSAGLLQRIDQLERRAAGAALPAAAPAPEPPAAAERPAAAQTPAPADKAAERPASRPSPPVAAASTSAAAERAPDPAPPPAAPPTPPSAASAAPPPAPVTAPDATPGELSAVRAKWEQIKQAAKARKRTVGAYLIEAEVAEVDGSTIVLKFKHSFHAGALQKDSSMEVFTQALAEVLGGSWQVRCEVGDPQPSAARSASPAPAPPPPPPAPSRPAPTTPRPRASTADDPSWPSEPADEAPPEYDEGPPRSRASSPPASPPLAGGIAGEDEAVNLFRRSLGARKL